MMSGRFDDEQLRAAYEPILSASRSAHGPECPSPEALLAATRGEGPEPERLRVLDHALRCPACRPELALLHSVSSPKRDLRLVPVRASAWRRFVPLAAAASVVLAVGLVTVDRWRQRAGEDAVRGGVAGASGIALIAPASEHAMSAGPVTFVWHPVAGAIQYALEVDDVDGTVLFTAQGADTVQTVANLSAGERRWFVRARMDDGSERRSVARVLRLR
jgi:hypothetical protein